MGEWELSTLAEAFEFLWRSQLSNIIATISLVVAVINYRLYRRQERRADSDMMPEINVSISPDSYPNGARKLTVKVRNNDGFGLDGIRLTIKSPRGAKLVRYNDYVSIADYSGEVKVADIEPDCCSNTVPLDIKCESAGKETRTQGLIRWKGTGDTDHEDFLLLLPPRSRWRSGQNSGSNSPRDSLMHHSSWRRAKCLISCKSRRNENISWRIIAVTDIPAAK
ncbi:MAG TPA: hypothetical protein DD739_10750 [Ochrobactrum anthropi]|nr:hypothetical protein [Brucella anthropi]